MPKILGHNARVYLGGALLAHTTDVSLNIDVDMEDVTDAESGTFAENLPTLTRWNIDTTTWYFSGATAGVNWSTVVAYALARTELAIVFELDGVEYEGLGYLSNVNVTGGTAAGHISFTAAFIGTAELC